MDFIRKVRNEKHKETVVEKETNTDKCEIAIESGNEMDNILSTQEMINDSRARREKKQKLFKCELCEFTSGSETLIERHTETTHYEKTSVSVCKSPKEKCQDKNLKKKYTSKRLKCKFCEKKFNKEETFTKHMKQSHNEVISENVGNHSIENDLPNLRSEVQQRVTRLTKNKTKISPWNPNN